MGRKAKDELHRGSGVSQCKNCGMFIEAGEEHECSCLPNFNEKICPMCGKRFYPPIVGEWAYRRGGFLICSWHCLCTFDKTPLGQKLASKDLKIKIAKIPSAERKKRDRRIYKAYKKGRSSSEIALEEGLTRTWVKKIIMQYERGEGSGEK